MSTAKEVCSDLPFSEAEIEMLIKRAESGCAVVHKAGSIRRDALVTCSAARLFRCPEDFTERLGAWFERRFIAALRRALVLERQKALLPSAPD